MSVLDMSALDKWALRLRFPHDRDGHARVRGRDCGRESDRDRDHGRSECDGRNQVDRYRNECRGTD